jgi:predicted amidophosphoribosyltransferase
MNTTPIEIDWFLKLDHRNLEENDVCYYFMEYTAHGGYGASDANQLILNFKKDLSYKNTFAWKYKEQAITQIAGIYTKELGNIIDFETSTLVPIPPSKCKTNALHDNRMLRLLNSLAVSNGADVRELLTIEEDMPSAHYSNNRNVDDIMGYLNLDVGLCNDLHENIYLFDDVLVTGSHFAACRNIILNQFPTKRLFGVFIARSIPQPPSADFEIDFS